METASLNSKKIERPFVYLNMAMTADGKIAPARRGYAPFGSERDLRRLFDLRASADGIISGAATLASGPIALGPGDLRHRRKRIRFRRSEFPVRIVASGSASLDPGAEIFRHRFSPIIVLVTERADKEKIARLQKAGAVVKIFGNHAIDWAQALPWLKKKWKIYRLLSEGGGELNASLFEAGVVDEVNLTICPLILGGRNSPTICDGTGFPRLALAQKLALVSRRRCGGELFLTYRTV